MKYIKSSTNNGNMSINTLFQKFVKTYVPFVGFVVIALINKQTITCASVLLSLYFIYKTQRFKITKRTMWQLYLVTPCILAILQIYAFNIDGFLNRDYIYIVLSMFITIDCARYISNNLYKYCYVACAALSCCLVSYFVIGYYAITCLLYAVLYIGALIYRYVDSKSIFGGIPMILWFLFLLNAKQILSPLNATTF